MIINKRISVGSLDVDPESGKIWLNSPACILRIQGVEFKHIEEKFAMIDVLGNHAYMIPGDFGLTKYTEFLDKLNMSLHSRIYDLSEEDTQNFLDSLYEKIQDHIIEKEHESLCEVMKNGNIN